MTENGLSKEFACDWGDRYSSDQMLEHATMHLYRHTGIPGRLNATVR